MQYIFLSNRQRSMVTFEATFSFKMFIFNFYKNLFDNCNNFEQSRLKRIFSLKLLWGRECNFELLHKMLELFTVFLIVILPSLFVVSLFPRQKLCVCMLVKITNWLLFKANQFVQRPENIFVKHSCFFFTLKNIKYRSNLSGSFNLAVTIRKMIIYTGHQAFPIAIMSAFRTKLYMQRLCT